MRVEDKLGRFTRMANTFFITTEEGFKVNIVREGKTVVCGKFRLVTKDQVARITGIVTESMLNTTNENGERVYEFQGNGWKPQSKVGDILLQDVDNPLDRWACGQELFGGTGWVGTVQDDLSVTYTKPGKPILAINIPAGTIVVSREGLRTVSDGCIMAVTNADKGDFYIYTPDVVQKYIRNYNE